MSDAFTLDGVLLVSELQVSESYVAQEVRVIQRRRGGVQAGTGDGEVDVSEEEGLRASVRRAAGVLGWAKEPEEPDHAEVGAVGIELAVLPVVKVERVLELLEDDRVDRVHSLGGVVLVLEDAEERAV